MAQRDDSGWGGGFMPWGLFRFRPSTQETKEAGPGTDWWTPLLQGVTAGGALFFGGALTYAALCAWDVGTVRMALAVLFALAAFLGALAVVVLVEDAHIAIRLIAAFAVMFGLVFLGDRVVRVWHGGDAADIMRPLLAGGFGAVGLVLGPAILLKTKDVRASVFYPCLFWLVGGGAWWAMPRAALAPWWAPMLTFLAGSVDLSAVILSYNFFRELVDNWRPYPPLERVMLQYIDRAFPELAEQKSPTFSITVQQSEHVLRMASLEGEPEDVLKFAQDALADRLATGKTLSRAVFGRLCAQCEKAGFIRLRNPRNPKDGYTVTAKGRAVFPAVIQEILDWGASEP